MKTIILLTALICLITAKAQIVNIPDAIFKTALLSDSSINTNGDGEIQVSEASVYNGSMEIEYLGISDLTGVEMFTALTGLNCRFNQLISLDVSANTALILLWAKENKLTSLDVSANTVLTNLLCQGNQLTSLNLKNGNNTILSHLNASGNPNLTCIQVDDTAYANANWSNSKDVTASFSENCTYTAIDELAAEDYFKIIPNPGNGKFQLQTDNSPSSSIKIYNLSGEIIYETDNRNSEIDISKYPKGVYSIVVSTQDKLLSRKLIIQ